MNSIITRVFTELKEGIVVKVLLVLLVGMFTLVVTSINDARIAKAENATLQAAIAKPAVKQEPKIVVRTREVKLNLTEQEKREIEARFHLQIGELEDQLSAARERVYELSYDGGSTTEPKLPAVSSATAAQNVVDLVDAKFGRRLTAGAFWLSRREVQAVLGYRVMRNPDVTVAGTASWEYEAGRFGAAGVGVMLRF